MAGYIVCCVVDRDGGPREINGNPGDDSSISTWIQNAHVVNKARCHLSRIFVVLQRLVKCLVEQHRLSTREAAGAWWNYISDEEGRTFWLIAANWVGFDRG